MSVPIIAGAIAGGVVGYIVGKDQQVQPIYVPKPESEPTMALPEPHTHLSRRVIGVGETRVAEEWQVTGNTIIVEDMTLTGKLFVRFNDLNSEAIALHLVNKIVFTIPFWRLFLDAPTQTGGSITIIVGIGLELHERPLKTEMAELAARLGSINTFDRRGDVVWMDNFEDNINKWRIIAHGTGASVMLSTESARNGARSAKLVTGAEVHSNTLISRFAIPTVMNVFGVEVSFALTPTHGTHILRLLINSGTHRFDTQLRYIRAHRLLSLLTEGMRWIDIDTNADPWDFFSSWNTMKYVVDIINGRYVRVLFDGKAYDVSNIVPFIVPEHIAPQILPQIWFRTATAANLTTYIDDFIFTQNEPL